jgi:hypothetical protein
MIVFIGAGLLVGGLLGARFTVMALVPAVVLSLSAVALAWVGHGGAPDWGMLHVLVLVLFLQVGYACGAGLRLFVVPLEVVRQGKALRSRS